MAHAAHRETVDVVLASMPFGILEQPSIGLGLLEASLDGPSCKVLYFTFRFAELVEPEFYQWICSGSRPLSQFLGEYLFRSAAFPDVHWEDQDFWRHWMGKDVWVPRPDHLPERFEAARALTDDFLDACADEILALEPKIVGFTSVFQQQLASLGLARRLKQRSPELFIVFGGANCEGPMGREMIRQFDFLDAVVSGEGELVFPELVDRVLARRPVDDLRGVSSAVDRATPQRELTDAPKPARMDTLPIPDYSSFFDAYARSTLHGSLEIWMPYETSRGCWWGEKQHCTFCGLNGASMAFRSKSGDRAVAELGSLLETYGVSQVQVVDNILDMRYFKSFIPALALEDWDTKLFYEVKANLSKEHLRQLGDAGITEIQPGIESLSSHILELMGKGVTQLQNVRLLKWCQELGLNPFWNVLWGFPGERPSDYEAMAALMPWLSHLTPPIFAGQLRLDRFSPNFEQSEALGFTDVRPDAAYGHLFPVDDGALSNLAYYFEYGYRDARDVASYTEPVDEAIRRWREDHTPGSLFCVGSGDSKGDGRLMIWDQRPTAQAPLTVLEGLDRQLYEACDDIRSLSQLARLANGHGANLESRLQPWVDRGLMLREGDKYLSLAVQQEP